MGKIYRLIIITFFYSLFIASCASSKYVVKEDIVTKGYENILSSISHKSETNSSKKDEKGESLVQDGLIEFVMKSKLQTEYKKLNQKDAKAKSKKIRLKAKESGIGRIEDTLPYKAVHILSTDKCSMLLEKKVILRKNLILCLKEKKMMPFLGAIYSYNNLIALNDSCGKKQETLKRTLDLDGSRKCYNKSYRKGKFISPLNLIK